MSRLYVLLCCGLFIINSSPAHGVNLLNGPESVEYDSVNNRYFVSNWYNATIVQIDSSGRQQVFNDDLAGSGTNMGGLHILNNILYAATCYGNHPGLWSFNLATGDTLGNMYTYEMILPNDITSDTSGFLYITDITANKIYKVNPGNMAYSTFVSSGLSNPNGICFDKKNNRLLVVSNDYHSPVLAISLADSSVSVVTQTAVGNHDGITVDGFGNFYISSWGFNTIYRYDSAFIGPPVLISSGHNGSADIFFDKNNSILAVPNIFGNTVDFIEMFVSIEADTTWGWSPLLVTFTGNSESATTGWTWDFGDGDSAFIQSPSHAYDAPGIFDVSLEVDVSAGVTKRIKKNYIIALSDSLIAPETAVKPGDNFKIEISSHNVVPLDYIQIPIEYAGTANAALDSFSITGCRTGHFDTVKLVNSDIANKRLTLAIYNFRPNTPFLNPGSGPILNLYFSVPPSASAGQWAPVDLDGYLSQKPEFRGIYVSSYEPAAINGAIIIFKCGDVNGSGTVNIMDITYLINYLYKGGPSPYLLEAADVNNSGTVNIMDITYLINSLYKGGPPPVCP